MKLLDEVGQSGTPKVRAAWPIGFTPADLQRAPSGERTSNAAIISTGNVIGVVDDDPRRGNLGLPHPLPIRRLRRVGALGINPRCSSGSGRMVQWFGLVVGFPPRLARASYRKVLRERHALRH